MWEKKDLKNIFRNGREKKYGVQQKTEESG